MSAIIFEECKSIGTYWIALNVNGGSAIYFDVSGVEYIPKKI